MEKSMEKIISLAKSRGFVYPGSEIYGGLANTWDYGNLGVELKNNVKHAWWQKFVQENPYNVGVDCAILMNPQTWVASGHLGGFSDPLMDCKACHERFRADQLIENYAAQHEIKLDSTVDGWSHEKMEEFIKDNNVPCRCRGRRGVSTNPVYGKRSSYATYGEIQCVYNLPFRTRRYDCAELSCEWKPC